MEIVIHGTKGGRKIFTAKQLQGLLDVNSDSPKEAAIGQQAYGMRFVENNIIFSKYKIIRDVQGDKRTGFVGFSLFLSANEKLSGKNIINLLDKVSEEYSQRYIIDSNLNDVTETWGFLEDISSEYNKITSQVSNDNYTIRSGSKDDAFICFKDESDLQSFFDKPLQEEYSDYRQILFINSNLKGKDANPLNALRNSGVDLSNIIDLKNEYYYLNNYSNSEKEVSITVDGKTLSADKNNRTIRENSIIFIKYSKDDDCFEPIVENGKLSDSSIQKYLSKNGNQIYIDYNAFNNGTPKTKTIAFELKDRKGNFINDLEIKIGTDLWINVKDSNFKNTFTGEDLKKSWNVLAKKTSENLYSDPHTLTPISQNGKVSLQLRERKTVSITAIINHTAVTDFNVKIKDKGINDKIKEVEFVDDEIDKTWRIEISKTEKDGRYEGVFDFCPKNESTIREFLKQQKISVPTTKSYSVSAGDYGVLKDGNAYTSLKEDGSDVKRIIVPNKGFKFSHFNLIDNTQIAQYEKKKFKFLDWKLITGFILGVLILAVGLFFLFQGKTEDKIHEISSSKIKDYVEGNELFKDTLDSYITNWTKQRPEIEEIGGGILGMFDGKEKQVDSTNYKNWETDMQSLNRAISKRSLIEEKDFDSLLTLKYSNNQLFFKTAIKRIDSTNLEKVKSALTDVSGDNLDVIVIKIDAILNPKKEPEIVEGSEKILKDEKEVITKTETVKSKDKAEPTNQKPPVSNATLNKNLEISKALKGSNITIEQLEAYEKSSSKFKSSIQLYLEFFKKVRPTIIKKKDFDKILRNVKNDSNLKGSDLEKFLKEILEDDDVFLKFSSATGRPRCKSLIAIKNKMK